MGFSAHEFWHEICPAQLFARLELFEKRRDREDARAALMPYVYSNAHRKKEDDEIPFETFLLHHRKEVTTPENSQVAIDASSEIFKAKFVALAHRMNQQKTNGKLA